MKLVVHEGKRSEIRHLVIKSRRDLRVYWYCYRYAFAVFAVIAVMRALFGEYIGAILTLVVGFVARLCFGLFLNNRMGMNFTERVSETAEIIGDELHYLYRIQYHSGPDERVYLVVPLNDIISVDYDANTCRLELYGSFRQCFVKDYGQSSEKHFDHQKVSQFVVYDYYEPSLYELVSKR